MLTDHKDRSTHDSLLKVKRMVRTKSQTNAAVNNDWVIQEQAIAFVFNGVSHAVMMATPSDLYDFAIGFSLSEGIINQPKDILEHVIVKAEHGIEVQLTISSRQFSALKHKRRSLLGNSGCGLCGVESLAQTIKKRTKLKSTPLLDYQVIESALKTFKESQIINEMTGSVHAAAFCNAVTGELHCIKEDVGRHNALDKLLGALAQRFSNTALMTQNGFILVSSRASYEMVDKTIAAGISHLVSISAATSKAIEWAHLHQLNLIGFARENRHIVYSDD